MASLLPLIQEILPMILPSSIHIVRGGDLVPTSPSPAGPEEGRVLRRDVIVDKTNKMCASVMVARPKSSSPIHHHGEQDTIIYVASGNSGVLLTNPDDDVSEPIRHALNKGDFAFVPAWTEHQASNESEEEDLVWVVIRSGPHPVEVSLTDWAGPEAKSK